MAWKTPLYVGPIDPAALGLFLMQHCGQPPRGIGVSPNGPLQGPGGSVACCWWTTGKRAAK